MKVEEMFGALDRDKVIAELERQRPRQVENREGHIEAWNEIVTLTPIPTEYSCRLDVYRSDADGKNYIDVSGLMDGSEDLLAIEFVDWREWISMSVISGDRMFGATPEAMLAAILHEMTFCGYSNSQVSGN
jgi:hypothetical protein